MKTKFGFLKKAALGAALAGSAALMGSQGAMALPFVDLPGGNTSSPILPVPGDYPPLELGRFNTIGQSPAGLDGLFGFNWPLFGTGVPGSAGLELMAWDIMSITTEQGINVPVGVTETALVPNPVIPGLFDTVAVDTNSNFYFDFVLPLTYIAPTGVDIFAWTYDVGGIIRMCQDPDGTSSTSSDGHDPCTGSNLLATLEVTRGGGSLAVQSNNQLDGFLTIDARVVSQVDGLFDPRATEMEFSTAISSAFNTLGFTGCGQATDCMPLQTFLGSNPPLADDIGANQAVDVIATPEPATLGLLGLGLLGIGAYSRRRRAAA